MYLRSIIFLSIILSGQLLFAQGSNPNYQWLNPKPYGVSVGWIKAWDENTIYALGTAGNFIKSTDGGQTFSINPNAGVPNPPPSSATGDLRAASFLNQNLGYICGYQGVTKTTDAGQTFTEVGAGSFPFTELRAIHFLNESTGFVLGSYSYPFAKTTDGGNNWTINTSLPADYYYDMKVFNEQRIVVAGSFNGTSNIYLTTNGGTTWTPSAAGTLSIFSMTFLDSLNGFAGSEGGKAYKTTNGGLNWNEVTTLNALPGDAFFSMFTEGSNLYILSYDSTLYTSTDAGASFTSSIFLPSGNLALTMRSGTVYGSTLYLAGDLGSLYKSTNNGSAWQTPTEIAKYDYIQAIYANEAGKIIAVGSPSLPSIGQQIIVSEDGGQNWTTVSLSVLDADLRSIKMIDANLGYTVGSGGSIWKTTNGGYNWNLYSGATTIQAFNSVDFYNAQYGMTAGNDAEVWKTTNGGNTWTSLTALIPYDYFNGIAMIDSVTALVLGTSIYKTTDGGTTWSTILPVLPDSPPSKIKMYNESVGVLVGPTGFFGFVPFVFKTTDGGNTWNDINFSFTLTSKLYDVEFRTADDIVVVGDAGSVFHTSNNGTTWTQFNLGLSNSFSSQILGVSFNGPNNLIVGGSGSQVVRIQLADVLPVELTSFICEINNTNIKLHWITATEVNNYGFEIERSKKIDARGETWEKIGFVNGNGNSNSPKNYSFVDDKISSGMYIYRLKQIDNDGQFEYSKAIEIEFGAPNKFELSQNYPNPFNPTTTISFTLPEALPTGQAGSLNLSQGGTLVKLSVYNILGQQVALLVNEVMESGVHTINFNASVWNSGIYFYKIEAGSFTQTKKMTLVK